MGKPFIKRFHLQTVKGKFETLWLWGGLALGLLALSYLFAPLTAATEKPEQLGSPFRSSAAASSQEILTLYAVADATVRSWQPNTNFGGEHYLELSYNQIEGPVEEVVLVRFDLSELPAEAIIDSAVMELYLVYAAGDNPKSLAAYYVTGAWAENTVTWNTFPTAQT